MSKELPEPTRSEEVDIIQIFNFIGKAFKSFFDFIRSIFEFIFKLFIIFTLFVKRNLIVLVSASVIGFVIGTISDYYEERFYTSTMVVQPNFGSNEQLLERLKLLEQLAINRDTITLGQVLKITPNEASQLRYIGYKPITNANVRLKSFNEFVKDADTLTIKNITFEDYEKNLEMSDYSFYGITVNARDKTIFKKIEGELTNIPITGYLKEIQSIRLNNMDVREANAKNALRKLDSLRYDYREVMLQEIKENVSKPNAAGNNIYLGNDSKRSTNEINLFQLENEYNEQLNELALERSGKKNFINVSAGFQDIGIGVKRKKRNMIIIGAIGIAVLVLLLLEFNKFLNHYEEKLKRGDE